MAWWDVAQGSPMLGLSSLAWALELVVAPSVALTHLMVGESTPLAQVEVKEAQLALVPLEVKGELEAQQEGQQV